MNEPSNADIYKFMGRIDNRLDNIESRIEGIHTQTKLTNGRVTKLERRNDREDDRRRWNNEAKSNVTPSDPPPTPEAISRMANPVDFTKIILALIGLSSGLVALVQFVSSQK